MVLNCLKEAEFFIEVGRRSHNLGAREERPFEPYKQYDLVFFVRYGCILN